MKRLKKVPALNISELFVDRTEVTDEKKGMVEELYKPTLKDEDEKIEEKKMSVLCTVKNKTEEAEDRKISTSMIGELFVESETEKKKMKIEKVEKVEEKKMSISCTIRNKTEEAKTRETPESIVGKPFVKSEDEKKKNTGKKTKVCKDGSRKRSRKDLKCDNCSRLFNSRKVYAHHVKKKVCGEKETFSCEKCGRNLQKWRIEPHLKICRGRKCENCSRVFTTTKNLVQHQRGNVCGGFRLCEKIECEGAASPSNRGQTSKGIRNSKYAKVAFVDREVTISNAN